METSFDIIIIGAGPGGYIAAIRAAQLGYRTAIVERYPTLGGTCTNVGCIPSKVLLDATEHLHAARSKFGKMGISIPEVSLDFGKLMAHKMEVVRQNTAGLSYLMKKNQVFVIHGTASFLNNEQIIVQAPGSDDTIYRARYFIIATGSKPAVLPGMVPDKQRIITSTEVLSLEEQPRSLAIIGGGVIGVEMASVYARMGTEVTILEYADRIIPGMDAELGKALFRHLSAQGIRILTRHAVKKIENTGALASIGFINERKEEAELTVDYCLIATGRRPNTDRLGLEHTSVRLDEKGRIRTDETLRTDASNIYAIGDVIAGPMLAHKAEEDGIFAVETLHGLSPELHYDRIPSVVYTWPEVASVGFTEEELQQKGVSYRKGKFPFAASGRARAALDTEGFVKILSDDRYGEILGVHIFGARAADMIAQGVMAMQFEITDTELGNISFAHPSFSEAIKDAARSASGKGALNI